MKQADCRFSIEHWREVLERALEMGYRFCSFYDYAAGLKDAELTILLRHDVDTSLEKAIRLARIEGNLGIIATYFMRLHSRFYNPKETSARKLIMKLSQMNVEIGLHYDLQHYQEAGGEPIKVLAEDAEMLGEMVSKPIRICSAHRAGSLPPFNAGDVRRAGLLYEAYEPPFFNKVKYISDSRGQWREGCLCRWLGKVNHLTVLTHPIWWFEQEMDKDAILKQLKDGD